MKLTRRAFLSGVSGLAFGAVANAREYGGSVPWEPLAALPPQRFDDTQTFFTEAERRFVTAAVDRLIPADDFPSASEIGVVRFIDAQLAGAYGRGDIFYLEGPFRDGLPTQGYQAEAPALLYRQAIADIEQGLNDQAGTAFADLSAEDQDTVLTALMDGSSDLENTDAATFFEMLWQNTLEGYFGDPVHGGNRDMASWRMLGFPGARYDYRPWIDHGGEPVQLEPVSVAGFAAASQRAEEEQQ